MNKLGISAALAAQVKAVPLHSKDRAAGHTLGWAPPNQLAQKEMFRREVIFDCDGVLVDWATPFCDFAGQLFNVKLDPTQVRFYHMGYDAGFPLSQAQFNAVFDQFARARNGYLGRPATPGIAEQIKRIHAAGIESSVWSWAPGAIEATHPTLKSYGHGVAQRATYELIRRMGIYDNVEQKVRFIRPGQKAGNMAEDHIPLIVEDNPATAVEVGCNTASACILVPLPYNETLSCAGVLKLNNHSEIADAVIDYFDRLNAAGSLLGGKR